ncbi:MAG: c-type cytochrome [Verrucomicrobia bacterium]|nr:c-type cytochrome [Verrucomicrobiota bacterium]
MSPLVPLLLPRVCILFALVAHAAVAANVAKRSVSPNAPLDCPPELKFNQPGVKLTLVAEHPQVMTPTGIDADKEGRVWVINSHTHFRPADYPGPKHDEIVVLSNPDATGRMQKRSVFYNNTDATMDLELGTNGWVYLSERGRILRVKDSNGDGLGDREEVLATLKTEETYPHNGMSGLAWHPSGDLIFALGENMWKDWTLVASDGTTIRGVGEGGIFRCKPDGSQLRRIAKGFWNPFGICVRADGEIFAAENDPGSRPPCRLLHIVEGGDYGYQRAYGEAPFHPFVCWDGELRGTLPMVCPTGEAPCSIAPLGGGLLVPSWADNRIDFFQLERRGASYGAQRVELVTGGEMFRPTCMVRASEGVYYIADWVFPSYPIHQRGRVWKLEIDPVLAKSWLKPANPLPPNSATRQLAELNHPKQNQSPSKLFTTARGDDPFLARAALLALARQPESWSKADSVKKMSERDRVSACLALKLAKPTDEALARTFLSDASGDVQFEALRWIADERLAVLQPEVERLLTRSDLDYRRFEACLAALNTLRGNSRAGVNDKAMLLERVRDTSAPPHVRGFALRLLPPETAQLTLLLLREMLGQKHDLLSLEAVRTLARKSGKDVAPMLAEIARNDSRVANLRAEAIVGLAAAPEEQLPLLLELAKNSNATIRDEALRALRFAPLKIEHQQSLIEISRQHPSSRDLVLAALQPNSMAEGRPPATDLRAWQKLLGKQKEAGDAEAGRRIFFHPKVAICSSCHMHSGRGNVVGPDLSAVGNQGDADWLLQSILEPNRQVAPQFFPTSLDFKDGTEFLGIKLRKGGSGTEVYRDLTGREVTIKTAEITRRRDLTTSLMPEGLLATLTDREIRDLLAFLSRRGGSK